MGSLEKVMPTDVLLELAGRLKALNFKVDMTATILELIVQELESGHTTLALLLAKRGEKLATMTSHAMPRLILTEKHAQARAALILKALDAYTGS